MDIQFRDVNYSYQAETPLAQPALHDINLNIKEGSFTAVIGKTGSGKSTLLQHFNALLLPTSGLIRIGDFVITPTTKGTSLKKLRRRVGIVFQFPEAQLFAQTVAEDIAFGPQNYGVNSRRAQEITREMIELVGLDAEYLERSPFELSGGQQRRVAIAGVLAVEPDVLILDEPTAGLDPQGRAELMRTFAKLNREMGKTIILVTHRMEDVAEYADQLIVMEDGAIATHASAREVFQNRELLERNNLDLPQVVKFAKALESKYGISFEAMPLTIDELAACLKNKLEVGGNDER